MIIEDILSIINRTIELIPQEGDLLPTQVENYILRHALRDIELLCRKYDTDSEEHLLL